MSIPGIDTGKDQSWTSKKYSQYYEYYMPWIEDVYLRWFGKDNKASYATKEQLRETKVSGNEQVDNLQESVIDAAGGQVGKGGLGEGLGNMLSKEGVSRAERGGKDETGNFLG